MPACHPTPPLLPAPQVLYNPARKPGNDKRPRIKGRFVTKTEFEQVYVMASDRTVPAATMQRA